MSATSSTNGSCPACGLREFERNRWFDGKLLVPRDFEGEGEYLRGKQRLHNSFLHGVGTVCGLRVTQHPQAACRSRWVVLEPGLAQDCCGHEIVVPEAVPIDLRSAIDEALADRGLEELPVDVYLRLCYVESDGEPVPALLDDCGCGDTALEHNRTREHYRLQVTFEAPEDEVSDPLEVALDWRHTLGTSAPRAILVDEGLSRLYVVDWDGTSGWIRVYDAEHHTLVERVAVSADGREPTGSARSRRGDLVYVAEAATAAEDARIAIFGQAELESDAANAARGTLGAGGDADVVRLETSARDDSLFALTADGRLLRWSSDAIHAWDGDPAGEPEPVELQLDLAAPGADIEPTDMTQSGDGRWMVVADGGAPRVLVVNLPQFGTAQTQNLIQAFDLPAGDEPLAVELSYDGEFLYVLCAGSQTLYRLQVIDRLGQFLPDVDAEPDRFRALPLVDPQPPAAPPAPDPVDIVVSPRDNWVYVLRRDLDDAGDPLDHGHVLVVSVDGMHDHPGGTIPQEVARTIRRQSVPTDGDARFETLAFVGQRLYVAGAGEDDEGAVSIVYASEMECDAIIRRTLEGCHECTAPEGVVIASLEGWDHDVPMVDAAPENGDAAVFIDNLTHRPILPSTDTLRRVIECMLRKGISEGIPGPRGEPGAAGPVGERGPGVTAVRAAAGAAPGASLVPIVDDPEGDFRLDLTLPRGERGPRGPGITAATASPAPGAQPTAVLVPIPGDPEGDFRLDLGIPGATAQDLDTIVNASWHHDEVMTMQGFADRFAIESDGIGLVVEFARPVILETLNERSAFALAQRASGELQCECRLPLVVEPLGKPEAGEVEVTWLVGSAQKQESFPLITSTAASGIAADAVRLVIDEAATERLERLKVTRLAVVLRCDWILEASADGLAVDGNNLWPGVPGRPSGNGVEGDDWISLIHLEGGV
jgi:DNA-binding beta-propeller fold protein YncE